MIEEEPGSFAYYSEELVSPHPDTPGFKVRDAFAHAQDEDLERKVRNAAKEGYSAFSSIFDRLKERILEADSEGQVRELSWNDLGISFDDADETLGQAMLLGNLVAIKHVEDQVRKNVDFGELADSYYAGFDEAPLLTREAVEAILKKIPLTHDEYERLDAKYRNQAFTISRLTTADLIEDVKQAMAEHIKKGGTFAEWRDSIDETFTSLGMSKSNARYLETVYRTNVQSAYNEGQRNYARQNQQRIALAEYHAIRDERTRPAHRAMHGFKAPLDSPVWNEWWPPNGFNCRCSIILISKYVAEHYGMIPDPIAPAEHPDEGWGFAPQGLPPQYLERAVQYGIPVSQ